MYDDHAKKYLTIKYTHFSVKSAVSRFDGEKGLPEFTVVNNDVRYCTAEDYGRTEKLKAKFEMFRKSFGDVFLCSEKTDFKLKGDVNS